MKKLTALVFVIVLYAVCVRAAEAFEISFPGAVWGEARSMPSPLDQKGVLARGWLEQGLALNSRFVTYAKLGYGVNPGGVDWYNTVTPALGVKYIIPFSAGTVFVGAEWQEEIRWKTENRRDNAVIAFVSWYADWNLKSGKR